MKTSFGTMCKIEVYKLIKRRDWLVLLALAGIGILFGASVLSESYTGEPSQSALLWICTQIFNSSILMITPLIFAFVSAGTLAEEMEHGSIMLYTSRYRNRGQLYLAKSVSVFTFTLLAFAVTVLVNLIVYYLLTAQNPLVASKTLTGENTFLLLITLAGLYLSSFLLTSQFALFLSAYMKTAPVIGIVFMAVMIFHNTWKVPFFRQLNPWYYVVRIGSDAAGTTEALAVNAAETWRLFAGLALYCIIVILLFGFWGKKKFESMDLS